MSKHKNNHPHNNHSHNNHSHNSELENRNVSTSKAARFAMFVAAIAASLGSVSAIGSLLPVAPASAVCEGSVYDPTSLSLTDVSGLLGAPAAWSAGFTGQGVDVALLDTGVMPVAGLASPDKIVDALDLSTDSGNVALRFRDGEGHGTNMAGIIAGDGTGGPLTKGVAPGARIINVKVGAGDGTVDTSQVIAAIDWVVQNKTANGHNIRVLNISYNTDATTDYRSDPLTHAVENAWRAGIVVVASAGNEGKSAGRLGNPAIDPYVVAVAASSYDKPRGKYAIPNWSSSGNAARDPDVVSPGASVNSLRVPGSLLDTTFPAARFYDQPTCTSFFRGSGTSQAAAGVSGAVAVLLQQRPTLTPDQVKALLKGTARSVVNAVHKQGSGMVNMQAMIAAPTPAAKQQFDISNGSGSLEASRGTTHVRNHVEGAPATPGSSTSSASATAAASSSSSSTGVVATGVTATASGTAAAGGSATAATTPAPEVVGEVSATQAPFSAVKWATASNAHTAWTNMVFDPQGRFVSGTWMGSSWSGSSWSGSSWSGSSWSGSSWSGSSWSGSSWSGSSWSGSSWSGSSWG
jgi:serine protease AprX